MDAYIHPEAEDGILHRIETYLTPDQAKRVVQLAKEAQERASLANSTDHDWLHLIKLDHPLSFMTPIYTIHWGKRSIRFVPRYPDPEEAEGRSDTWDNISDEPEPENLGDQIAAKEAATVEPIYRFPIKDPTETQIKHGLELRARRDRHRKLGRTFLTIIVGFFLFNDCLTVWRVREQKYRIETGLMEPPFVVLVVDAGNITDGNAFLPAAINGDGVILTHADRNVSEASVNGTNSTTGAVQLQMPSHYAQRPLPVIKQFRFGYPLPIITFFFFFGLLHLAMPPLFTPRARIAIYEDKLVAIPLMIPIQHQTLLFSDVIGIDIRGEETPSGTMYFRYRRYVHDAGDMQTPGAWLKYKQIRGYLYSGLGDLGILTAEDQYLVILRTRSGVQPVALNVQGLGIEKLQVLLDSVITNWRATSR
ncbi:hypothetical protein HDV05_006644 [Chytridiales sp. JEL 0842]|nr:hypothetical protein HDV05_006644 [Chytridiales sp. JEL 0842]